MNNLQPTDAARIAEGVCNPGAKLGHCAISSLDRAGAIS